MTIAKSSSSRQQDRAAHARPDVTGQPEERFEPGLQLGDHIGAAGGPGALGGSYAVPHSRGVAAKITRLVSEWLHDLLGAGGPAHPVAVMIYLKHRAGGQ